MLGQSGVWGDVEEYFEVAAGEGFICRTPIEGRAAEQAGSKTVRALGG